MINCEFESKKIAQLRHVVVDALIVRDGKVLLTKRSANLHEAGKWCLPGGYVDRDETIIEAVMREVHEEIGYTCEVQELFTIIDKPQRKGDDRQNISFVFQVRLLAKVGELDPTEVSEMTWFDLTKLPAGDTVAFDHFEIIWNYIDQNDSVLEDLS